MNKTAEEQQINKQVKQVNNQPTNKPTWEPSAHAADPCLDKELFAQLPCAERSCSRNRSRLGSSMELGAVRFFWCFRRTFSEHFLKRPDTCKLVLLDVSGTHCRKHF